MAERLSSKLNRILKSKKIILGVLLLSVMFTFLLATAVFAADQDSSSKSNPIMAGVVTILGWIAYVFAHIIGLILTLVTTVLIEVAQYSDIINVEAVEKGWVIVRDLCNMLFILILLVIAFATILRVENYNVKKLLPKLLIMAVLINFSRTICGLIIDFSQVIMLTFVNGFSEQGGANFVSMFQMDKYLSMETFTAARNTSNLGTAGAIIAGLLSMIITAILMIVMLAVLVIRLVLLWVYVVVSPIAFLASAFPFGEKYSKKWWSDFSEQVTIGPILAFFIWLALATANSSAGKFQTSSGTSGSSQLCAGQNELFCSGNFQTYIITIGLLVAGLIITKEFSGELGKTAGKGFEAVKGKYGATPLRWGRERWDAYRGMKESIRKEKAATGFLGGTTLLGAEGRIKQGVGRPAGRLAGGLVGAIGSQFSRSERKKRSDRKLDKYLDKADEAADYSGEERKYLEKAEKYEAKSLKLKKLIEEKGEAGHLLRMAFKPVGGISRWGAEEASRAERYKSKEVSKRQDELRMDSEEDIKRGAYDMTSDKFSRMAAIFEGTKKRYFKDSEINGFRSAIKDLSGNNKSLISKFEAEVDQHYQAQSLLSDEQKAKKIQDGDWAMKDLGIDSLTKLIGQIVENTKPGAFKNSFGALSKGKREAVETAIRGTKNAKTGKWEGGLINDLTESIKKAEKGSIEEKELERRKYNAQQAYAKIKSGGINKAFEDDEEGKIKFIREEKELDANEASLRLDAKDLTPGVVKVLSQAHIQNLLHYGDDKQLESLGKALKDLGEAIPKSISTIMEHESNTVGQQINELRRQS